MLNSLFPWFPFLVEGGFPLVWVHDVLIEMSMAYPTFHLLK